MPNEEFADSLQDLVDALVDVAFEYVDFNEDEVDAVYLLGSPTNDNYFNNFFYKINGEVVSGRRINTVIRKPVDLSTERATAFFAQGSKLLAQLAALFQKHKLEVPRIVRVVFDVKESSLGLQLDHKHSAYPLAPGQMVDVFMDWLDAVKEDEASALAAF
ncbi:MAG: hypothetical protein EOO11_13190 [Chitinophagaceae bacterium]|nr:MAG: hypothetical protein EOO11_13190 [Chitinophagaceae bacterium]